MPANVVHPVFQQPFDPNIKIWRYMDFAKYVSLLETDGLWFSRADKLAESFEDKFGDPFEGTFSRATANRLREMFRTQIKNGELAAELDVDQMVVAHLRANQWMREWTYVNSWHMNERESAAMWRLYARTNEAVAVQSTYARLRDCLPSEVDIGKGITGELSGTWVRKPGTVYLGKVRYIDYATEPMPEHNAFYPFVYKRKSFEHERELRAVIPTFPLVRNSEGEQYRAEEAKNSESGKLVQVSLEGLIEGVYVAPSAPTWFRDVVEAVTSKYSLAHKPIRSSLDEDPLLL